MGPRSWRMAASETDTRRVSPCVTAWIAHWFANQTAAVVSAIDESPPHLELCILTTFKFFPFSVWEIATSTKNSFLGGIRDRFASL